MILSIECVPLIQKKITLEKTGIKEYRVVKRIESAVGLGIDFCYMSKILGQDCNLLSFIGQGNSSKLYQSILNKDGIYNIPVEIKDKIGEHLIIEYSDRVELIRDNDIRIVGEEINKFFKSISDVILDYNIVFISYDNINVIEDDALKLILNNAVKNNVKLLLRIDQINYKYIFGVALDTCLVDVDTLEEILNIRLLSNTEIIKAANYLLEQNVKEAVFVIKDDNFFVVNKERVFEIEVNALAKEGINTGYFMAGVANSINRAYDIEMMIRLAFACGLINRDDLHETSLATIKENMKKINIITYNNIEWRD
ncbi:hypothetical protein E4100_05315 [Soehngenia longivitae]|uniref:Carbohydrate kinase PfkB domain-containing protein n=1 Tax=Soehngenia longivitae TaxID=2562294 RepID=A0A4Z0D5T8_9FIRM|nr:hypothetical protein [Soehngenia longivitae]TFZ40233.1 hypothetical protein E4100_05315 [Soehngenia longivitae]